jgi:hypothetical protein
MILRRRNYSVAAHRYVMADESANNHPDPEPQPFVIHGQDNSRKLGIFQPAGSD